MSKTLLLLKLLQGEDVRNRSLLLSRQHVYATLQLNHEVEVRSTTALHAGSRPEFNQLFMLELGPWWKGKDMVLQLFAKNRMRKDAFLGGCSCKLGELVRAVGLDDSGHSGTEGGGHGGSGSYALAEVGSGGVGSFATASASPSPSGSPLSPMGGVTGGGGGGDGFFDTATASLAPAPGLVSFQRVSAEEVRRFGELLPVLPGANGDEDAYGVEGVEQRQQPQQSGAANNESADGGGPRSRSASSGTSTPSSTPGGSSTLSTASPLAGPGASRTRLRARSVAPAALPITWIILRHGGGPAALRQFPPPQWRLPAGRLAIYLDYIVLPPSSIPKMMSAQGRGMGGSGASTPLVSSAAAAAAERERRQLVSLPSTILPNGWLGMSDNEKLAWAHAHRRARAAPLPQPMGGLVAFVARGLLGAGAGSGSSSHPSGVVSPLPLAVVGGVAVGSGWPFPWAHLQSVYATFLSSNVQDRVFYSWYAVLGLAVLMTELMFTRPDPSTRGEQFLEFIGAEEAQTTATGTLDPSADPSSSSVVADWPSSSSGAFLWSLAMGVSILKFGWNMLNDHQISHPWRRLDLVLTLLLGLALGAAAQIAAGGTAITRVLGMGVLAVTHAYARATLYQAEVVAGVLAEQFRPLGAGGGPGAGGRDARLRSVRPLEFRAAVLRWTCSSLVDTFNTGVAWVTGKAARTAGAAPGPGQQGQGPAAQPVQRGIPGSIQLCLRSCFFLVGSVCAQWLLLPVPSLLRWWLSALTWPQVLAFVLPLFLFMLLFMFGNDSAALRGRPWLMLFGLNSLLYLYASLRFLPVIGGLALTAAMHTVWSHKWALLALPLEWAAAAAFVPAPVWDAATAQERLARGMHVHVHAHGQGHHKHAHSPINPLHINDNYINSLDMQQQQQQQALQQHYLHQQPGHTPVISTPRLQPQQEGRVEGRRSGSATPARM